MNIFLGSLPANQSVEDQETYFRVKLCFRDEKSLPQLSWEEGCYPQDEAIRRKIREYTSTNRVSLDFLRKHAYLLIERFSNAMFVDLEAQSVC